MKDKTYLDRESNLAPGISKISAKTSMFIMTMFKR